MDPSLPAATGESATAVTEVTGMPSAFNRSVTRTTSVVMPLRLITMARSYDRPAGSSVGVKASVTPWPSSSRRAANACATNHDVPHPSATTRSDRWGSGISPLEAISAARRHIPGCVAISRSISNMAQRYPP